MSTTFDATASPWKPCDLRGPYPESISESLFSAVGAAIGSMLPAGADVLIAGDFRTSTVSLKTALSDGLVSTGVTVLDAGQLPTPVAYFTGRAHRAEAVCIVTASHNPPRDNGLKLMIGLRPPSPAQLLDIRARAEASNFRRHKGQFRTVSSIDAYERQLLARWGNLNPRDLPALILDAGNGAWSDLAPRIFRQLGFAFKCLGCVPDGGFPTRPPDCARTANLEKLRAAVSENQGALGIAWDGDGDRVALVDENGEHVSTDEIAILLARDLLSDSNNGRQQPIVVDIKFSDLVRRTVHESGGRPLLERSGHSFMRARLIDEDALLGLDACGHYFFRELEHGDDGLFSALFLLGILQKHGLSLATMRKSLPRVFASPELRVPAALLSYDVIAARLKEAFPSATLSAVDGTRLTLPGGVVLARESSTEPAVSLRVEGFSLTAYHEFLMELHRLLPEAHSLLAAQLAGTMNFK
jgi:phosphomannomutase / phosphoglucomutase